MYSYRRGKIYGLKSHSATKISVQVFKLSRFYMLPVSLLKYSMSWLL